ncbi:MAG: hypothetical protein ACRC5T_10500 [Cetobacterium sp.]
MTVTKNPMVLQSCNYIYNWFITQIKTDKENQEFNLLEVAESDRVVMEKIKKDYQNRQNYSDIKRRLDNIKGVNDANY